jgi:hypothetical protein
MKHEEQKQLVALVERIVREVLARLTAGDQKPAKSETPDTSAIRLVGRVISLADVKQLPADAHEILVSSDALITPAARDELRERGVQIVRGQQNSTTNTTARSTTSLVIGTVEAATGARATVIDQAIAGLRKQKQPIEQLPRLSLAEQIDALVDPVVRGGRRGVLVTSEVSAALCLANRHGGVRAVLGTTRQNVRRDVEWLAANLLVVDPAARSTFEVMQLIGEFAKAEAGPVPESLRKRLD